MGRGKVYIMDMSTTRTHTATYYAKGMNDAYAQATACRRMVDALADIHRTTDHSGAADLIASELDRMLRLAGEYEREAEIWIEDAAANGHDPEDLA